MYDRTTERVRMRREQRESEFTEFCAGSAAALRRRIGTDPAPAIPEPEAH
jgi:hypothetical protein